MAQEFLRGVALSAFIYALLVIATAFSAML